MFTRVLRKMVKPARAYTNHLSRPTANFSQHAAAVTTFFVTPNKMYQQNNLQGIRSYSCETRVEEMINLVQKNDRTALATIAKTAPTLIVEQTSDDKTALHEAARLGNTDMINTLATEFNEHFNVNHKCHCYKQRTPLHYAVEGGHETAVKRLLELGADPNITDENSLTSLDYAARGKHKTIVIMLLNAGGTANGYKDEASKIFQEDINEKAEESLVRFKKNYKPRTTNRFSGYFSKVTNDGKRSIHTLQTKRFFSTKFINPDTGAEEKYYNAEQLHESYLIGRADTGMDTSSKLLYTKEQLEKSFQDREEAGLEANDDMLGAAFRSALKDGIELGKKLGVPLGIKEAQREFSEKIKQKNREITEAYEKGRADGLNDNELALHAIETFEVLSYTKTKLRDAQYHLERRVLKICELMESNVKNQLSEINSFINKSKYLSLLSVEFRRRRGLVWDHHPNNKGMKFAIGDRGDKYVTLQIFIFIIQYMANFTTDSEITLQYFIEYDLPDRSTAYIPYTTQNMKNILRIAQNIDLILSDTVYIVSDENIDINTFYFIEKKSNLFIFYRNEESFFVMHRNAKGNVMNKEVENPDFEEHLIRLSQEVEYQSNIKSKHGNLVIDSHDRKMIKASIPELFNIDNSAVNDCNSTPSLK